MRIRVSMLPGSSAKPLAAASVWACVAASLLTACDRPTAPLREGPVAFVGVVPGEVILQAGETFQLEAVTLDSSRRVLDRQVTWSSSDPSRAVVSPRGLVEAVADGSAEIIAEAEGISGSMTVRVDSRTAVTLEVQPDSVDLPARSSVQLRAIVRDSSGDLIEGRRVEWSSSDPSVLEVRSDGYARAVGHDALVTVTARLDDLVAESVVNVLVDPCIPTQPIEVGQTVSATLTSEACRLSGGSYADRWRLDLDTETSLRIEQSSSDFDPYLLLTDLQGNVIEVDDDSGEGSGALIFGAVPAGSYIVWATSYHSDATGEYSLSVVSGSGDPCAPGYWIGFGQSEIGYLSVLDCQYQGGQYVDGWMFDLTTPTTVRALMQSSSIDAFLTLTDWQGNTILWDNDSGGGRDAEVATTLPAGSYVLWASSYGAYERGRYTLSLDYERVSDCRSVQRVMPGDDIRGYLTTNDCRLDSGQYADRWRLDLPSARTIRIDLMSSDFDAFLMLTDLEGAEIAAEGEGGTGTDARLELRLESGSYIIWTTSKAPDRTGSYLLSVR